MEKPHDPMPYVVRLRVTADEDTAPQIREFRMDAYGAMEALVQAAAMATDTPVSGQMPKYSVEHIGPDTAEYERRQGARRQEMWKS